MLSARAIRGSVCFAFFVLIRTPLVAAADDVYYVSPRGNDAWSGLLADPNSDGTDGPWKTLAKACSVLEPGDTCRLRGGVYRETLKPLRDGSPESPIVFDAYPDEQALLSGTDPVEGWEPAEDGLFRAPLAWDLGDENQVFAGKEMLTEARWPNLDGTLMRPVRAEVDSGSANTIVDPKLPGGDDFWKGAVLWCAGGHRWYCWNATVTGFDTKTKTLTFDKPQPVHWYTPKKGNPYVLMGVKNALDAEGEWWLDRKNKTLWLKPPKGRKPDGSWIEAKRRTYVIDLSGRSHIHIRGIHFRAGGIRTDAASRHLSLRNLNGRHIGHSYVNDISGKSSVLIKGRHIEVVGCELAYSSGSLIRMEGSDNRLINCYLHHGDYAGKWNGAASFSGRRQLISHNTIRHSGRDVCSVHGLMESLVQHNDLSHAGWLTADLGMTYGHDTDFMGTVFRYNRVHDNLANGHTSGIYFDHCSHNAIIHHNVIWNVPGIPLQVNNPAYFMLCYNNSVWNGGRISTFDHSHRNDMFGCRFMNNILPVEIRLPEHVVKEPNLVSPKPGFVDTERGRFELLPDSPARGAGVPLAGITATSDAAPDLGASPETWKAGHDFANPPKVRTDVPEVAYANTIRNAAFELGSTEGWTATGKGSADIVPGNGWGNGFGRGEVQNTGTSKHELRLSGKVRVEQKIENLRPGTRYQLSAWLKTGDGKTPATLGVRGHGGPEAVATHAGGGWERKTVDFTTGPEATSATVFVEHRSEEGMAFVDNLGLPRY